MPPGKSHTGILDLHSDYLIIGSEAALFCNSRSRAKSKFLSEGVIRIDANRESQNMHCLMPSIMK